MVQKDKTNINLSPPPPPPTEGERESQNKSKRRNGGERVGALNAKRFIHAQIDWSRRRNFRYSSPQLSTAPSPSAIYTTVQNNNICVFVFIRLEKRAKPMRQNVFLFDWIANRKIFSAPVLFNFALDEIYIFSGLQLSSFFPPKIKYVCPYFGCFSK